MTDQQQCGDHDELRDVLMARRRRLAEDLQRRIARIRESGSEATITRQTDDDTADLDLSLLEIAAATLRRIDVAIERLGDGAYGRCARCRGPIGPARLRALPFAVCCQQCEAVNEREKAQPRPALRQRLWSDAQEENEQQGSDR